jgi:hypothetical protein
MKRRNEEEKHQAMLLNELPGDVDLTLGSRGDLREGAPREVEGVVGGAAGAEAERKEERRVSMSVQTHPKRGEQAEGDELTRQQRR